MKIPCRFGIHDWSDWEYCIDDQSRQERYCMGCGIVQQYVIKVFGESTPNPLHEDSDVDEESVI